MLAEIRVPESFAQRIQVVKNGAFLRFVAADSGGGETEISTRIDGWNAGGERHVVTATWTYQGTGLYLDGEPIGEARLREPIAQPIGAMLQIGSPGGNIALENVLIFGRP
jgi:hypothetical protein